MFLIGIGFNMSFLVFLGQRDVIDEGPTPPEPPLEPKTEPKPEPKPEPKTVKVKAGQPTCPSGSGGFFLGKTYGPPGADPTQFVPPKYIGPWGEEASISCEYMRDSGEREYEGEIIYDDGFVQVEYQTSGTFEARPGWATES